MEKKRSLKVTDEIPAFDREFFASDNVVSRIGGGSIGGKATGLAFAHRVLSSSFSNDRYPGLEVSIPRFVVIGTDLFDAFMERNDLHELVGSEPSPQHLSLTFQRASFPAECVGDLRGLITKVHSPLAVRSSSMLEDDMYEPFAGVYGTKMIPNNQGDTETRFKKLIEAIKFVYASVYSEEARGYFAMIGKDWREEKMAVIIQEVVGRRHDDRFYPDLSGVGRSYNFYPVGGAAPESGVIDLALGLGKSIVDGGKVWSYSPDRPKATPPYTTSEFLKNTQTDFWCVNMGKPPAYDPVKETEYLMLGDLAQADQDRTLSQIASTYLADRDRIQPGTGYSGPRILNFAPLLQYSELPFNALVRDLLTEFRDEVGSAVEIEFAATLSSDKDQPPRLGFLQVRPMVVSEEKIDLADAEFDGPELMLSSHNTLGNGVRENIRCILYVKPDNFDKSTTRKIVAEINSLNRYARERELEYILIGFGRWGSSDPWLGIPADWGDISMARVIVEATLPEMDVEMSQGSHFFHNITSLRLPYLCVHHAGSDRIDWAWLYQQEVISETERARLIRTEKPLTVRVDGRTRRGVIVK